MTETQLHETTSRQNIEARLWQDPLAAVAKYAHKARGTDPKATDADLKPTDADPDDSRKCKKSIEPLDTTAEVLGVMLPGGPYAELSEVRRRTRYAVLSGLETRGFIGKVEDHIGCWRPKPSKDRSLPHEIPYEDFEQENPKRQTRVLWLNEDLFSETPLQGILSVVYELRKAPPRAPDKIIGPYTSGVLESIIEEARNGTLPGRKTPPPGIVVARNGGVVTHKEGCSSSTQYSASRLAQVSLAQAEPPPNEANQHHPLCPDPQNHHLFERFRPPCREAREPP